MNSIGAVALAALVANPWNEVPDRFRPMDVMGRGYWSLMTSEYATDPEFAKSRATDNPELREVSVFKDCALSNYASRRIKEPWGAWRTVAENYGSPNPSWDALERFGKMDKPLFVTFGGKRTVQAMVGPVEMDFDDYRAWKARHPNLFAIGSLGEWDNDLWLMYERMSKMPAGELKDALERTWGKTAPSDRYEMVKLARRYFDRVNELHYGDIAFTRPLRASMANDFLAAAWGVKMLGYETTSTTGRSWTEYRWDASCPFTRGAARQFSIPWEWYIALYSNAWTADGEKFLDSAPWFLDHRPDKPSLRKQQVGTRGGISASLTRRAHYYAYLNGANFVMCEGRTSFTRINPDTKLEELTDRGRDYVRFHDFTKAHPDRGATYTPVALLVPFAQGYPAYGGPAWNRCPYLPWDNMVDAFLFTLCLAWATRPDDLKKGLEGNLHNSKLPMMCDVLAPDAPQPRDKFLAALRDYPVAVLAGLYPDGADLASALKEYVKNGGPLVLNAAYLGRKGFDANWTGAAPTGRRIVCGRRAIPAADGAELSVDDDYELVEIAPAAGAETLLADENGAALVTAKNCGTGRVVVFSPDRFVPKFGARSPSDVVADTRAGRRKFVFADYLLTMLAEELFPVRVTGDCQYGLNKTRNGWWLWVLNNKGVTKFADAYETIDASAAAKVTVELKGIVAGQCRELVSGYDVTLSQNGFSAVVPAGETRIFELKESRRSVVSAPACPARLLCMGIGTGDALHAASVAEARIDQVERQAAFAAGSQASLGWRPYGRRVLPVGRSLGPSLETVADAVLPSFYARISAP